MLGKSADHAKGADIATLAVASPESAIELWPLGNTRTFGTKMVKAFPAPAAAPACRDECEHDVVPDRNSGHLGTNSIDNPGSLMTKHHRLHRNPALAPHHVIVGAAKANGSDADKHFRWTRRIKLDLLDRQRRVRSAIDSCS
jgi:hypothetical protein